MKKSYVLVLLAVVLIGLWLISVSDQDKRMREIKHLELSVKKEDNQLVAAVKPDLNFGKFPLYFITNKGQVNEKAKFYAKASRYTLWLTKEGLVFDSTRAQSAKRKAHSPEIMAQPSAATKSTPAAGAAFRRPKPTPPFGHPSQEGNSKHS